MEWSSKEEVREGRSSRVSGRTRWVAVDMIGLGWVGMVPVVVVGVDMVSFVDLPVSLGFLCNEVAKVSRLRDFGIPKAFEVAYPKVIYTY